MDAEGETETPLSFKNCFISTLPHCFAIEAALKSLRSLVILGSELRPRGSTTDEDAPGGITNIITHLVQVGFVAHGHLTEVLKETLGE